MRRPLIAVALLTLSGCASPAMYDPNLLTVQRQGAADRWAADVARRNYVSQYMNAICTEDGPWSTINKAWLAEEKTIWTEILWKFEPIPKTVGMDWSVLTAIIGAIPKATAATATAAPTQPPLQPCLGPSAACLPPC